MSSSFLLLLLFNNAAVAIHASARLVQRMFLGKLREAEIESLNERSWRYLAEILSAITVFLPDFTFSFFGMEAALFNLKGLHWLAQKRFRYLKATPLEALNSQLRFCSFLLFLLAVDSLFLYIHLLRSSALLYFVFEYVILVTNAVVILIKYVFFVADMLMEGQFERKAMYTFQLELVRDLLHLLMKSCIIFMLFPNYRIPLLSLYKTFCKFKIRVADYLRYRKITSNLNEHFLNVTTEELQTSDATCIICREEMTTAKKLHCGHLFHVHCLRSWLERKASCPTCRSLIVPTESQTA
ncbi:E3 ubiquitin protein ligase RIN2 [Acorus calamus]|uniref:RING-type E3 ubiquitin transferase n=1 Tax=Acorus calamus TaxID=4465 RepID=A0AAV9EGX8_ACOCL|nr:E3 ubiquitin protein ligase RIN2 [Acorus calamus]